MKEITPWISLTPLAVSPVTAETKVAGACASIWIFTFSQANQALMQKHHMVSSGTKLESKEGKTQSCLKALFLLYRMIMILKFHVKGISLNFHLSGLFLSTLIPKSVGCWVWGFFFSFKVGQKRFLRTGFLSFPFSSFFPSSASQKSQ